MELLDELWFICKMDFYAAVKKNELSYMLHSGGIAKTYLLSKLSNVCSVILFL